MLAASSSSPNPASGQAHGNCSTATSARARGAADHAHMHAADRWDIISLSEIQKFPCHRSVSNNEVRRLALPWDDDGEGISSRRWSGDYGWSQIFSSSTYAGAESNLDRPAAGFRFPASATQKIF